MFLLCINDINEEITSHVKLFADDCLPFGTIESAADTLALQKDLHMEDVTLGPEMANVF